MLNILYAILPILILLIIIHDFFYFIEVSHNVKFKNLILDLDTEKSYSLNDIESIYMNTNNRSFINEYNLISIEQYIKQIKGNLIVKNTKYYTYTFCISYIINIFRQRKYNNNKENLIKILSSILEEIANEKKFFGLNTREKEIFRDLITNTNLNDSNKAKLDELKIIVTDRYQELLKKNEESNKLSTKSMRVGYISLTVAFLGLIPIIFQLLNND